MTALFPDTGPEAEQVLSYMRRCAAMLDVSDLLERALGEIRPTDR